MGVTHMTVLYLYQKEASLYLEISEKKLHKI